MPLNINTEIAAIIITAEKEGAFLHTFPYNRSKFIHENGEIKLIHCWYKYRLANTTDKTERKVPISTAVVLFTQILTANIIIPANPVDIQRIIPNINMVMKGSCSIINS